MNFNVIILHDRTFSILLVCKLTQKMFVRDAVLSSAQYFTATKTVQRSLLLFCVPHYYALQNERAHSFFAIRSNDSTY